MERKDWKKDFGLLWAGQAVSVLTSSVVQMALIWTLTMETQSAMILSLASLAGFLPNALLGTFAGAIVDRIDRKKAIIGADLFIAAVSLILVFISTKGMLPIGVVLAVLAIRSVGTSFHTPAISATAPLIVPSDKLMKCAGYTHSLQTIGYIAGTALAGLLYPVWSLSQLVFLDVIGALIASLAVLVIKIPKVKKIEKIKSDNNLWKEMKEGYIILHQEKGLFAILWTAALFMILYSPINALFPLLTTDYFKGTTWHCAVVEMAYSIGMLVGSICIGLGIGMRRKGIFLVFAVAMMGLPIAIIGILPNSAFAVFVALSVVMGLSVPFYNAPGTALYQEKIAPEYLGRVFGLYGSVCSMAMPIGLMLSGIWADSVGINRWFLISGVLITLISVMMLNMKSIRDIDKLEVVEVKHR